jgi:hypothetical protein
MAYLGNAPGQSTQRVTTTFTATEGQTTFTPVSGYTPGYVDVYLNGVKLIDTDDYVATNGVTIVLNTASSVDNTLEVVAYIPRGLSDGYTKLEADARYEPIDSAYTKAEADSRYATEVQGALADSAVQPDDDVSFGALSTDSLTVDGSSDQVTVNGTNNNGSTLLFLKDSNVNGTGLIHYNSAHTTLADQTWIKNYTPSGSIFIAPNNQKSLELSSNGNVSFYEDTGTTAKMVWSSSDESLEIGGIEGVTAFPLSVKSGTNNHAIAIEESSGLESWQLGVDADGDLGFYNSGSTTASVTFDDSGNLLVGTTSTPSQLISTSTTTGLGYEGTNGYLALSRAGTTVAAQPVVHLNRAGVDGDIATFRKYGSAVGSIGVKTGTNRYLTIGCPTGTPTGLIFDTATASIGAWNVSTNAGADNTVDLGISTRRFKDLYLSGGVYLGGTAADNKLDYYEEGTWTPVFGANTSQDWNVSSLTRAAYVRIGKLVMLNLFIPTINPSTYGATGTWIVSGLPFPMDAESVGTVQWNSGITLPAGRYSPAIRVGTNLVDGVARDTLMIRNSNNDGGSYIALDAQHMGSVTYMRIFVSYMTN